MNPAKPGPQGDAFCIYIYIYTYTQYKYIRTAGMQTLDMFVCVKYRHTDTYVHTIWHDAKHVCAGVFLQRVCNVFASVRMWICVLA